MTLKSSNIESTLSSSPEEKCNNTTLLDRIGGPAAVAAAVEIFYEKLLDDERLVGFFAGHDVAGLIQHQNKFLTLAFTEFPPEFGDPGPYILKKHARLFKMGLKPEHFDMVAGHLVETFKELGVKQHLIDEAIGILGKLRAPFEEGARLYGS